MQSTSTISCKRKRRLKKGDIKRNRINDLPDDLLIKILLRLPMLAALHSKLVCRHWYALLSSPFFAECFAQKPKIFSILMHNYYAPFFSTAFNQPTEFKGFSINFLLPQCHDGRPPRFLASCNDLLLCGLRCRGKRYSFAVCNPITKKYVRLPPPPIRSVRKHEFEYGLHGLLCYSTGRYAVVRIPFPNCYFSRIKFEVFSSDTFEWSQKSIPFHPRVRQLSHYPSGATPYNGLLFWLFRGRKGKIDGLIAIDPFDLCKPPCIIDKPRELSSKICTNNVMLTTFAGCLRLFQISKQYPNAEEFTEGMNELRFSVWDLKLYDKKDNTCYEWVLYREVTVQHMISPPSPPGELLGLQTLACHPDNPDIVYVLTHDQVLSCNLLEQQLEEVCEFPFGLMHSTHAYTFVLPWQPTPLPPTPSI